MCGVRMTLGRPRSSRDELVALRPSARSGRRRPPRRRGARCPGASRSASWSMTKPRRQVEEQAARPHPGELLLAEEAAVAGPAVDVQGHHVGDVEQLVQGGAAAGRCPGRACRRCRRSTPTCRGSRRAPTAGCRCCRTRRCRASRPRTSWLPSAALSQTPACMPAFFSVSRRVSAMISARASSTTLRVLENGALNTAIAGRGRGRQVDLVGADAERADREQLAARPRGPRR